MVVAWGQQYNIGEKPTVTYCTCYNVMTLQSRTLRLKGIWFWCPCMEINVSVQYNGGLLPDIILSTRCNYIGEPF